MRTSSIDNASTDFISNEIRAEEPEDSQTSLLLSLSQTLIPETHVPAYRSGLMSSTSLLTVFLLLLGYSQINRQASQKGRIDTVDMISGINNEQYPDKRLHMEATHRVLCSTESLFPSDFTPTYSGDNSTTQTFDKLSSRCLEHRELGSSTGWLKRPAVVFSAAR